MPFRAWRRVTVGASCPFCLMLASRGAVYRSEESAGAAKDFHAHCDCRVELETDPANADEVWIDPQDANRVIEFRKNGRTYTYDLTEFRGRGVTNPPKPPVQPKVTAPRPSGWKFDGGDVPRYGSTKQIRGSQEWLASLSEQQSDALKAYTGKGSELSADSINEVLAQGFDLSPKQADAVQLIDEAISKAERAVDVDVPLYRGVERYRPSHPLSFTWNEQQVFDAVADVIESEFVPGKRITLGRKGYSSTSTDVTPALDASLNREAPGLIFEIAPTNGAPLSQITKYDDEFEVLISRSAEFEVVKVLRRVEFVDSNGESRYRTVVQVRRIA